MLIGYVARYFGGGRLRPFGVRKYSFLVMRIASLVPSATEMLFALGLGDDVVAVTHECDYPPAARKLPRLTRTVLRDGLDPRQIDSAVKATVAEGRALYELDEDLLAELAPDLIVTQAVCDVCAVSFEEVTEVASRLPSRPRVLEQDPSTLGEMLDDVNGLGQAAGISAEAREARGDWRGGSPPSARRWRAPARRA
jgi:iron complex transport system substrate-binding protein